MAFVLALSLIVALVVAVLLAKELRRGRGHVEVMAVHVPSLGDAAGEEDPDGELDVTKVAVGAPRPRSPGRSSVSPDTASRVRWLPPSDQPEDSSQRFLLCAAAQTDAGKLRRRNEDAFLLQPEKGLFAVADGMGGCAAGDVASRVAMTTIEGAFASAEAAAHAVGGTGKRPELAERLVQAIQSANTAIVELAAANEAYTGMGSTVVGALFSPTRRDVHIAYVGDSRSYRFRKGALEQLTTDHTMANKGVSGPLAGDLFRALGARPTVRVDVVIDRAQTDDVYLLCSDGLFKMVGQDEIARILASDGDLQASANALVSAANEAGGRDNVTVVLVRVQA